MREQARVLHSCIHWNLIIGVHYNRANLRLFVSVSLSCLRCALLLNLQLMNQLAEQHVRVNMVYFKHSGSRLGLRHSNQLRFVRRKTEHCNRNDRNVYLAFSLAFISADNSFRLFLHTKMMELPTTMSYCSNVVTVLQSVFSWYQEARRKDKGH